MVVCQKEPFFTTSENDYVINQFFPIETSDQSFQSYFNQFKKDNNILPINLIPIVDDAFGNLICMQVENNKIYLWNHEDEGITYLSPSLEFF
jgi:hypothetical protein